MPVSVLNAVNILFSVILITNPITTTTTLYHFIDKGIVHMETKERSHC